MTNYEKEKIKEAINTISWAAPRVLIADCYEGYELRRLKEALALLLDEADKK